MARRSKDPAQAALFDLAPEPKPTRSKVSQVKYVPMKRETVFMVVGYRDGEERYHQSVPESYLPTHLEFNKKRGYDKLTVLGWGEYWEMWHEGTLTLGHA